MRKSIARIIGRLYAGLVRLFSSGRVQLTSSLRCHGLPVVWASRGASVVIAQDAVLVSSRYHNPVQPARRCSIRAFGRDAHIAVGSGFRATGATVCAREDVQIGSDVFLGSDVLIVDSDFHAIESSSRIEGDPGESAPTRVGSGAWIGARAIVLKGVVIGERCVIGAGSVVVSDIPDDTVAAGNPCRVVREIARGR